MATTQEHLPIEEVKDDVLILKDGSMAVVLQTTAVNFGLLSENEQLAIIGGFAALLNSLSFAIQILIRSKRLDVTSYLHLLDTAQQKQTNPLLAGMMVKYRAFIEKTVRENDVLDKQFYIIVPVSFLELGVLKNVEGHFQKGLTILLPRRDQIIRQLWRTGLKASQLNNKQLINLFYDFYNPPVQALVNIPVMESNLNTKQPELKTQTQPTQNIPQPQSPIPPSPTQPTQPTPTQMQSSYQPKSTNLATPFVVEELADDYGTL